MLLEVSQESLQGKALWIPFNTIYACATTGARQVYQSPLTDFAYPNDSGF